MEKPLAGCEINSAKCGRDKQGVFHCACGKCKDLNLEIRQNRDNSKYAQAKNVVYPMVDQIITTGEKGKIEIMLNSGEWVALDGYVNGDGELILLLGKLRKSEF